jgi:chorismate dehydratase
MLQSLVRVSCVSYLNSQPFIFGLKNHKVKNQILLSTDNPADCARKLIHNEADIGLVPVASIPNIENSKIISDYCIAANGNVKSVLLLSNVPLHEITDVLLDYQSMTSVSLVRVLADKFWNIRPRFVNAVTGFENEIAGTVAAVVIGDRALGLEKKFRYVFDLAGEWKKFCGLPFVFACWVSNKPLDSGFVTDFNDALSLGVNDLDAVIVEANTSGLYVDGMSDYLKRNLSYTLDESKIKAMNLFLDYIKKMNLVAPQG